MERSVNPGMQAANAPEHASIQAACKNKRSYNQDMLHKHAI
jgi:hypothetical protein